MNKANRHPYVLSQTSICRSLKLPAVDARIEAVIGIMWTYEVVASILEPDDHNRWPCLFLRKRRGVSAVVGVP